MAPNAHACTARHATPRHLITQATNQPAGSLARMQERILSAHPRYDRVNRLNGTGFQPHMSIAKFADKVRARSRTAADCSLCLRLTTESLLRAPWSP